MVNKTAKKGNDSGKLNQNGTFEKKGALLKNIQVHIIGYKCT